LPFPAAGGQFRSRRPPLLRQIRRFGAASGPGWGAADFPAGVGRAGSIVEAGQSRVKQDVFDDPLHRALYLTGPTAAGKTAVGVALARRLGAEVIALDSMTLYRGMDIGTAKPTPAERMGLPHHLIDVLDPWQSASVAEYRSWALAALASVEARGKRALFVGGTALYLKALLRGLFDGPGSDPALRRQLEDEADRLGDASLHARLGALDPATAARLHPHDRRRVIRAHEVIALTGRPMSRLQGEHDRPAPAGVAVFALERPRAELRDRIDRRVVAMFADGLVAEVAGLQAGTHPLGPVAAQAVGYREVLDHLAGRVGLDETVGLVQARTRQFAKRQATWFRGLAEVRPWPVEADESPEAIADRLAGAIAAGSSAAN
jgi:tRNA dimethylallyltransferase